MKLESDQNYKKLTKEEKAKMLNGCGPEALKNLPWYEALTIQDNDFRESCNIHDWDFAHSSVKPSPQHLKESNERLLRNMLSQASGASSCWRKGLLYAKAYLYYGLCKTFGGLFYKWTR